MISWGLVALCATIATATNHRERPHAYLHHRDIVGIGPSGTCPAVSTTVTAYLQPVFYEEFFPYNSVIVPFRNGVPFTVSDAPADVIITSTLTSLLTGSIVGSSSGNPATGLPPAQGSSSIASFSTGLTTSTPTSNAGLAIGQGLPTGTVGNLADENFIFLAFTTFPRPTPAVVKREENVRRQIPSTRPLFAVDLVQPPGALGGLNQDDCDSASPLLLRQGRLVQYALTVGKRVFEIAPLLGFLDPPAIDQVDATFSLVDGVLQWDATDFNVDATFFDCEGVIYAAFDTVPPGNCVPVIVGAIAGSVCLDRVRQTRTPNPAFVAPIPASSSSSANSLASRGSSASGSAPSLTSTTNAISLPSSSSGPVVCRNANHPDPGAGTCGCSYEYYCNEQVLLLTTTRNISSFDLTNVNENYMDYCAMQCDDDPKCLSFLVSRSNSTCTIMDNYAYRIASSATSDYDYGQRRTSESSTICQNPQCTTRFGPSNSATSASSSAPSPSTSLTDCQRADTNTYSNNGTGVCGCLFERLCYYTAFYLDEAQVIGLFQLANIDENHMDYCERQCDNNVDCRSYLVSRSNNTCTLMDKGPYREGPRVGSDLDVGQKSYTLKGSTICQNPQCVRYYGPSTSSTTIESSTSTSASSTSAIPTYSSDCGMARNPYSPDGSCNCQYYFECDTYGGIGASEGTSTTISIADVNTNHLEYCAAQCDADAACKSFLINNEAQTCTLNTNYAFMRFPGYTDHKYDYGSRSNTCGDPQCCIRGQCSVNPFTSTVTSTTASSSSSSTSSTPSSNADTCESATNPSPAGRCGCPYTYECHTVATFSGDPGVLSSYDLSFTNENPMDYCAANCDNQQNCRSFSVSREQGRCFLYSRAADMTSATDADLDYGERKPGVCLDPQCSLPASSTTVSSSSLTTTSTPTTASSSSSPTTSPIDHSNDCDVATNPDRDSGTCGCAYTYFCDNTAGFTDGSSYITTFRLTGTNGNYMNECATQCDGNPDCKSFALIAEQGICNIYNRVADSRTPDSSIDYGQRDSVQCLNNQCTFTATTTSSSSSSSSPSPSPAFADCQQAADPDPATGTCGCGYTYRCNENIDYNIDATNLNYYTLTNVNGNYMDYCALQCDNDVNCKSFYIFISGGEPTCSTLDQYAIDKGPASGSGFDYGARNNGGSCLNPQCGPPSSSTTAISSSLTTTDTSAAASSSVVSSSDISSTSTTDDTSTSASTSAAASSSSAPSGPVNDCSGAPSDRPGGFCGCRYNFYCSQRATYPSFINSFMQYSLTGETGNRMDACGFHCDSFTTCRSFVVDVAAQRCLLYQGTQNSLSADGGFDYGERANSGSCVSTSC